MDGLDPGREDQEEHPLIKAEQAVLGCMLMSAAAVDEVVEIIAPRDFYRPAHQVIAHAIITMHAAGDPVNPITLADVLLGDGDLPKVGGALYLHTLYAAVPTAASAGYYAQIVAREALRRKIREAGTRMVQRANAADADPVDILAGAERDLADAVSYSEPGSSGLMTIDEFCEADFPRSQPVIPGMLHQGERVILVAGEGMGKSTLARQLWVMTAAGLHPFTGMPVPPKRALYIDLENPPSIVQAKARPLRELAAGQRDWDPSRAMIWSKPGGVDMRSAADQHLVRNVVKQARPDLIVAGPLYKMAIDQGERAEQLHSAVAKFWDTIRELSGAALWLEAHAPMAQGGAPRDLRPLGSGVWQRWPEFGLCLQVLDKGNPYEVNIGRFRGDRDERQWPRTLIRRSWNDPWPWPWKAIYPKGTFTRDTGNQAA